VRSEGKAQLEELRRWFADHRATVTEHAPADESQWRIETLYWAKPGTGHLAVRYIIMGPVLMVWGDLESAVYRWSSVISWNFLAGCDLQYFESKCEASPKGRDYEDYDSDLALHDFNDAIKRHAEEGYKRADPDAVDEARRAIRNGQDEWHEWMRSEGYRVFGDDWYEWLPGLGKRIAHNCAAHLVGIKMAVAQMTEKPAENQPALAGAEAP
jgi:hypothetical protein